MTRGLLNRMRRLAPFGWAAVFAAPFVSHLAITTGRFRDAASVLALVEVTVLAAVTLRRKRGWSRVAGGGIALVLLGVIAARLLWPESLGATGLMAASGASQAIIYASLLALFWKSLRPGRTALITRVATRVRGPLSPPITQYTQNVTIAWCWFFGAQLAASALLLLFASHSVWSLYVNVLDAPLVATMFAAEYAIRRWRFRDERHISPAETIRSFARSRASEG